MRRRRKSIEAWMDSPEEVIFDLSREDAEQILGMSIEQWNNLDGDLYIGRIHPKEEQHFRKLIRQRGFKFTNHFHALPNTLPTSYPHERPEHILGMPEGLHKKGLPSHSPLPVLYLEHGELYLVNADIIALRPYYDILKPLCKKAVRTSKQY